MDARTSLRRRVGDTPLVRSPELAKAAGLPNLRLKMEGANPTGTQKDRIARLEVAKAATNGAKGISVASCGNFGVAVAHAAFVHNLPCKVFVPADFQGERVTLMEELGATVHRVPGMYEDAVRASRDDARQTGWFDANPGGANTLGTLVGYSTIAKEIIERMETVPAAVGAPIGNGSTLAGVHLGFKMMWAQGKAATLPAIIGGTSQDNNPIPVAVARGQDEHTPVDPRSVTETAVNEPLVNWDALDGTACLVAIRDSGGTAYGFTDEELLRLHDALIQDGIDAHPASLSAVAALMEAAKEGRIDPDAHVVAVMTSGRPRLTIRTLERPSDKAERDTFTATLKSWLGRFGDPEIEMEEAIDAAFEAGCVLAVGDDDQDLGYCVLTPMELKRFFPGFHLSYIAVSPDARGLGVGSLLLEEAVRWSDGDLSLHVETDNEAAIRLYEKFGFNKKYYRMLYKGSKTAEVDPATGSGWTEEAPVATN